MAGDGLWLTAEATAALALHAKDTDGTCVGCREFAGTERSWSSCAIVQAATAALEVPGRLASLAEELNEMIARLLP